LRQVSPARSEQSAQQTLHHNALSTFPRIVLDTPSLFKTMDLGRTVTGDWLLPGRMSGALDRSLLAADDGRRAGKQCGARSACRTLPARAGAATSEILLWVREMRSIVRASQRSAMNAFANINTSAMLIVRTTPRKLCATQQRALEGRVIMKSIL